MTTSIINNFLGKAQSLRKFNYSEIYDLKNKTIINSGLLIPLSIIDIIGEYNDKIPLDFSDFYFIEKYKTYKSKIILLDSKIKHSLSGDESKDFYREFNRYRYYCLGAYELSQSLRKTIWWAPTIRLINLLSSTKIFLFYKFFILIF